MMRYVGNQHPERFVNALRGALQRKPIEKPDSDFTANVIDKMILCMDEKEQKILRLRLDSEGPPQTLAQVASTIGLSSDRVRQIEDKAFRKLWFIAYHYNISDPRVLDEIIQERKEKALAVQRAKECTSKTNADKLNARRQAREDNAERKRAHARQYAWRRKLQIAERKYSELIAAQAALKTRVDSWERQHWIITILPPLQRKLATMRNTLIQLEQQINESSCALDVVRRSQPHDHQHLIGTLHTPEETS